MPLESIKKRILSESETKAEGLREEADSEARRIVAEAKTEAKEIGRQAEQEAEAESKRIEGEARAGMEIEANTVLLEARGTAIENAVREVSREIESLVSKEHLLPMLKSGVKQFKSSTDEPFVVVTSKRNANVVESMKLTPRYEDVDGFVVESEDGRMRLVISAAAIVSGNEDRIRSEVAGHLNKAPHSKPAGRTSGRAKKRMEPKARTKKRKAGRR